MRKKITDFQLEILLESARLAPSGSNTQPWTFIIVESEETKGKLLIADNNQKWMKTAPVFNVV